MNSISPFQPATIYAAVVKPPSVIWICSSTIERYLPSWTISPRLADAAVFNDDDYIGMRNRAEVMRDDETRSSAHELAKTLLNESFTFGIKIAGGRAIFESDTGLAHTAKSSEKTPISSNGAAESAALRPELAIVVEAWPRLYANTRSTIVGMARTAMERIV
jgi:hypothetical protein